MAESLLHTQKDAACFYQSCPLAFLDACNGDPDTFFEVRSAQSRADFATEDPQAQMMAACDTFPHPTTLFEVPNARPCANVSGFAHLHATSAAGRAECVDFACPEELHAESSPVYALTCEESTHLHEECADSTVACGNYGGFTCPHVGSVELCNAKRGVACTVALRGNTTRSHEGIQDASTILAYPCVEGSGNSICSVSSKSQPCVSECISTASMVTDTISESTSASNVANMDTEFIETHWTDAKHRSYLTFMEANFVKLLYRREYCALDVCGHAPCYPGSCSFPLPSTLCKFKSGQSGEWSRKSTLEPPFPACIPLKSPWVNHFRRRNSANASHQIKAENARTSIDMDEGEEVDSPSTFILYAEESQEGKGIHRHRHAPRSKMVIEEKHMSKDGSNGDVVVAELKRDVLQEFAQATVHSTSFPTTKKRGFQPDCEQKPSTRHKREQLQQKS